VGDHQKRKDGIDHTCSSFLILPGTKGNAWEFGESGRRGGSRVGGGGQECKVVLEMG